MRCRSAWVSPVSSETRSPVWTATSSSVWSRRPIRGFGRARRAGRRSHRAVRKDTMRGRSACGVWPGPAGLPRRARDGVVPRRRTGSGSRRAGRYGSARCCRAHVRGGPGTPDKDGVEVASCSRDGGLPVCWVAKPAAAGRCPGRRPTVCGLAWRWAISRSVKKACRVGASGLMAASQSLRPAGRRPGPSARARLTGTSYSDIGITGITPILGLFRYPLLCARDGPVTWDDALW